MLSKLILLSWNLFHWKPSFSSVLKSSIGIWLEYFFKISSSISVCLRLCRKTWSFTFFYFVKICLRMLQLCIMCLRIISAQHADAHKTHAFMHECLSVSLFVTLCWRVSVFLLYQRVRVQRFWPFDFEVINVKLLKGLILKIISLSHSVVGLWQRLFLLRTCFS